MLLPTAEVLALGRYSTCILILKCVSITYHRNPAQIHISKPLHWFYDLVTCIIYIYIYTYKNIPKNILQYIYLQIYIYTYMTCWQYLTSIPTCPSDISNVWVASFTEFQVFAGHAWYYPDLPEGLKNPLGEIHFGGKHGILHGLGLGAGLGGLAFGRERDFWADVMKSHFP